MTTGGSPPARDKSRRGQDSYRRRLAVLQAAGNQFAVHGYRDARVADIASSAGVSKGLVFHFFGTKQGLFESLLEDTLDQWSTLSEYRAAATEQSALDELRSLFLASFEFVAENPVLLLFSRNDEGLMDAHRHAFSKRNKQWRKRIRRTLDAGVERGEIRDMDTRQASWIFHELQSAMLTSTVFTGSAPRYNRRKVLLAIDIYLRGIQPA